MALLVTLQDRASEGLKDIGKEGGNLGDLVKGGAMVAGGAILAFGGFLVGATKAAADEQVGIARLSQTLKNAVPNWDGNTDAVEAYIAKQEKLAFSDDELRDSLSHLVGQTKDLKEAQNLQATAMDLARAKGISLEAATKAVGKVDQESIGILKKLGIQVDENMTKEQALTAIRAATAGQAEAYANTAAGSMERLQNTLSNAFETIGGAILPLVTGPLQALADWFQSPETQAGIQALATGIGEFLAGAFQVFQEVLAAVTPIIQPFVDAILSFFGTISGGGDIMAAFGQYFTDLGGAIGNAWNTIAPALGTLLGNIVQWVIDNGPTILATLLTWVQAFWDWIVEIWPGVMSALSTLISSIWNWITTNAPIILEKLGEWVTAFWDWIVDIWPGVVAGLGTLISSIWDWIVAEGPGILLKLGEWVLAFLGWIVPMIPPLLLELAKIALALLGWIAQMALDLGTKIVTEWIPGLWNWITGPGGVLEVLPPKLGEIAGAIWTWLTTTAGELWTKLINEWVPKLWEWITGEGGVLSSLGEKLGEIWSAVSTWISDTAAEIGTNILKFVTDFWNWITGPDGVVAKIGDKLGEIWDAITGWISDTATKIFTEVAKVGKNVADGIGQGFKDAWVWVQQNVINALTGLPTNLNAAQQGNSPARLFMPVGENAAAGIYQGFADQWLTDEDRIKAMVTALPPALRALTDDDAKLTGQALSNNVKAGWDAAWLTDEDAIKSKYFELPAAMRALTDDDFKGVGGTASNNVKTGWDGTWGPNRQAMVDAMSGVAASMAAAFKGPLEKALAELIAEYERQLREWEGRKGAGGGGPPPKIMGFGGPVGRNETVIVGDRGPELFTPNTSGRITPMSSGRGGGGGSGIHIGNITIHAPSGADGARLATEFMDRIEQELGQRVRGRKWGTATT